MDNSLIVLDSMKEKRDILEGLNKDYIIVFEEKEDLINKHKVYLEAQYLMHFGGLIRKKFEVNIEYRRLKAKLTKIVSAINKQEPIDLIKIENELELELMAYYEELNKFNDKLKYSKGYFESPCVTKEELLEIKRTFRDLAKKLHPDVALERGDLQNKLWSQVVEAYDNNDLVTLLVLKDMVYKNINLEPTLNYNKIDSQIERIKNKIEELKCCIEKTKKEFPFDIEKELEDLLFINNKKISISKEIEEIKAKIELVNKKLIEYV